MNELIGILQNFKGATVEKSQLEERLGDLDRQFKEIATYLITGGYLLCNNKYRLYITSVEFYYHEEEKRDGRIEDPIMYHRNKWNNYIRREEEFEYFPIGTFYPHESGVDITFECPGKYRASALIREFYITRANDPNEHHNCKYYSPSSGWGKERSIDIRPSYVYEWLFNGLEMCKSTFTWIEEMNVSVKLDPIPKPRINVYAKTEGAEEMRNRQWRYTIL